MWPRRGGEGAGWAEARAPAWGPSELGWTAGLAQLSLPSGLVRSFGSWRRRRLCLQGACLLTLPVSGSRRRRRRLRARVDQGRPRSTPGRPRSTKVDRGVAAHLACERVLASPSPASSEGGRKGRKHNKNIVFNDFRGSVPAVVVPLRTLRRSAAARESGGSTVPEIGARPSAEPQLELLHGDAASSRNLRDGFPEGLRRELCCTAAFRLEAWRSSPCA